MKDSISQDNQPVRSKISRRWLLKRAGGMSAVAALTGIVLGNGRAEAQQSAGPENIKFTGGSITDITSDAGTITVTDPTGPTTNVDLPSTGVTAGSYWSTNLTVDEYGRITAASNGNDFIDAVAEYGADPSGSTDSTTALNNAYTASTTSSNTRKVYLRPGTYLVSGTVTFSWLEGAGWNGVYPTGSTAATIIVVKSSSMSEPVLQDDLNGDWQLRNISVQYQNSETAPHSGLVGIQIGDDSSTGTSSGGVMERISVDGFPLGISVSAGSNTGKSLQYCKFSQIGVVINPNFTSQSYGIWIGNNDTKQSVYKCQWDLVSVDFASTTNAAYGIVLQSAEDQAFHVLQFTGNGSSCACIVLDFNTIGSSGSADGVWPGSNLFDEVDFYCLTWTGTLPVNLGSSIGDQGVCFLYLGTPATIGNVAGTGHFSRVSNVTGENAVPTSGLYGNGSLTPQVPLVLWKHCLGGPYDPAPVTNTTLAIPATGSGNAIYSPFAYDCVVGIQNTSTTAKVFPTINGAAMAGIPEAPSSSSPAFAFYRVGAGAQIWFSSAGGGVAPSGWIWTYSE